MYFAPNDKYETQMFQFKVFIKGKYHIVTGYYNPNSIEGGVREQMFQIQRYLEKEYPWRRFVCTGVNNNDGMCVKSFDLLDQSRFKDNPISAFLPVWDDSTKSAQFKVW